MKTIYNHIVEFKASDRPVIDPLSNLFSFDQHSLKFWDLPVRNFEKTYQEITSANRGSNLPFPADFSFHLRYTKNSVTIFEDHGTGCVYKLFILPILKRTNYARSWIHIDVDDVTFSVSIQEMYQGTTWPFVSPISTNQKHHAAGIGAYTPICYQKRINIHYVFNNDLPSDILENNIKCTLKNVNCQYQVTTGVSSHKFPFGTRVKSFAGLLVGILFFTYVCIMSKSIVSFRE